GELIKDENPTHEQQVLEPAERPILPRCIDGHFGPCSEGFAAPPDEGHGENPGPKEERGKTHQEAPQGDAGARSHYDRPMAPMFLAELILVTDVGVATIGMAAVRHGLSTVRHRRSRWPERDP